MTTLLRLQDWTAKRSGARITVIATLPDGQEARLSVDRIDVSAFGTLAIDKKRGKATRLEILSDG